MNAKKYWATREYCRTPGCRVGQDRRERLFRLQGGLCFYCKVPMTIREPWRVARYPTDFSVDHVIPRSRGGSNLDSNVVGCCNQCNTEKADGLPFVPVGWDWAAAEESVDQRETDHVL